MENTPETTGAPVVVGVIDNRSISLDRLASDNALTTAENLRFVLPGAASGRVAAAAFGSCI